VRRQEGNVIPRDIDEKGVHRIQYGVTKGSYSEEDLAAEPVSQEGAMVGRVEDGHRKKETIRTFRSNGLFESP